jgi:hypothetical protein
MISLGLISQTAIAVRYAQYVFRSVQYQMRRRLRAQAPLPKDFSQALLATTPRYHHSLAKSD